MIQTDLIFNTHAIHCATIGRKHKLSFEYRSEFRSAQGDEAATRDVFRVRFVRPDLSGCAEFPDFAFVRAGFSADLALQGSHRIDGDVRMTGYDDAWRKPVPTKNVNGISASPVNLFSSYCCARKKNWQRPACIFSCMQFTIRASIGLDDATENYARCIEINVQDDIYRRELY